ncbi:MAG: Unknown protein [uncultured Sulfurovum sp.]|uniref:Ribbon-helix-helix protein CopG domain-containing protein n=1 Tax=uncultured Sulfurovum sp. TaxID=269237 RepID=A0A6S6TUM0_9BACT|nr:MAG: Unknown protein [uncultured Sulfurovum sp.]CAA6823094.1 MAG: Unknown protein [uncultured Sulfurovum sp.]
MTVRKNFTMPESIVYDLEELSRLLNKKQSQVIQELIEERMKAVKKQKKLDSLEKMSGMFSGLIPEHVDMQWIKSQDGH